MELYQLAYFCELARCQHMTQAAQRLSISQPALSKALRLLEQELETELFTRRGRGIQLNDNGIYFYDMVSASLGQIATASEELRRRSIENDKVVTLANMIPEIYTWFFESFVETYPGIQLQEAFVNTSISESLRLETADFALSFSPVEENGFTNEILIENGLLLLTPPEHPWSKLSEFYLPDNCCEPFIAHNSGLGISPDILGRMSKPSYMVADLMMVIRLVEQGYGVSLMPSFLWLQLQPKLGFLYKKGRVPRPVPISGENSRNRIYISYLADRNHSKNVKTCIEFCLSYFSSIDKQLSEFRDNGFLECHKSL